MLLCPQKTWASSVGDIERGEGILRPHPHPHQSRKTKRSLSSMNRVKSVVNGHLKISDTPHQVLARSTGFTVILILDTKLNFLWCMTRYFDITTNKTYHCIIYQCILDDICIWIFHVWVFYTDHHYDMDYDGSGRYALWVKKKTPRIIMTVLSDALCDCSIFRFAFFEV